MIKIASPALDRRFAHREALSEAGRRRHCRIGTGGDEFYFVDGGSVAVNVNAGSWTLDSISGNSVSQSYASGGAGNEDGIGFYNLTVNSPNTGPSNQSTTVTLTLTDTSGTWASESSVLSQDLAGNYVAAHIGVCDLTVYAGGCAVTGASLVTTGLAAGSPGGIVRTTSVPEPATWAMMLARFAGLGYAAFRRSRANRPATSIA